MGGDFSGSCAVTSRNSLLHNGATNATRWRRLDPEEVPPCRSRALGSGARWVACYAELPRIMVSSTLAIEPHGKAHLFAFLGCPLDFSRVGVGVRPAKSYRCLHRPNSPPLWCLRGGVGGDGTRRWPKRKAVGPSRLG